MRAYYNENEPFAAEWLRNLIKSGLITPGDVDDRSITEVRAEDLVGYDRVHMFAGIGGWDYALNLAGWGSCQVWTGSCPCQPFSAAGKRKGIADERHLWPDFHRLIAECRPSVIFGEQVAKASDWLNLVRSDLEAVGYAVGCQAVEAASADADHFRDRYWFVADAHFQLASQEREQRGGQLGGTGGDTQDHLGIVADSNGARLEIGQGQRTNAITEREAVERDGNRPLADDPSFGWGEGWTESEFRSRGFTAAVASIDGRQYVEFPDGKWRRLPPPRVRWLAHGIPARVAKLRAIGNAIDPRPAAEFIQAYREAVA